MSLDGWSDSILRSFMGYFVQSKKEKLKLDRENKAIKELNKDIESMNKTLKGKTDINFQQKNRQQVKIEIKYIIFQDLI